jgi:hypothetical protein
VRLEGLGQGLGQFKNPMTLSEIEPATFRLVAWCLNQIRHLASKDIKKTKQIGNNFYEVSVEKLTFKMEVANFNFLNQTVYENWSRADDQVSGNLYALSRTR